MSFLGERVVPDYYAVFISYTYTLKAQKAT